MSQTYRLTAQNRPRILELLGRLDLARDWLITIEPFVKKRTTTQNARWWALMTKAADATGYAPEEIHEIALKRHFGTREIDVGGIVMEVPAKRSSVRNTKEFAELMDSTESWLIEKLGVWLE